MSGSAGRLLEFVEYIYIIIYIIYNIIYICINGDNWGIHSNQLDAYFVGISKIGQHA